MSYHIIVFKNTLDAMTAEKELNSRGMKFKMMPTPTIITQSCGLCVRIDEESLINKILEDNIIKYKKIYKKDIEGYSDID